MRFTILTALVPFFTTLATSLPTADQLLVNGTLVPRGSNGADCQWYNLGGNDVRFQIHTWGPWGSDWGHGLLDNLRGQCGSNHIVDWGFDYGSDGRGRATFTDEPHTAKNCVENSVWVASSSDHVWGLTCNWVSGVEF